MPEHPNGLRFQLMVNCGNIESNRYVAIKMLNSMIAELENLRCRLDAAVLSNDEEAVYQLDSGILEKYEAILKFNPCSVTEARIKVEFLTKQLAEHADASFRADEIAHMIVALFDQFAV